MNQNSKVKKSKLRVTVPVAGVMTGALALLSASEAHAADYYARLKSAGDDWVMGNSNFNVNAQAWGRQSVRGSFTDDRPTYETRSEDTHSVGATVFGTEKRLISAATSGLAESRSGKYASVGGHFKILGSSVWTADPEANADCPPSDIADTACDGWDKDVLKTFFSAQQTFMVSFVPVTVKASVGGGVYAHLSANTIAMQGLPANKKHHLALITLGSGAGAFVSASLTALAGIEDVLAVGVTAKFRLIDAAAVSTSRAIHRNDDVLRSFNTKFDFGFNITSMSGTVDVWAQITPWIKPSTTLISVAGFSKFIPLEESSQSFSVPELAL
jgi:hypothetical protein